MNIVKNTASHTRIGFPVLLTDSIICYIYSVRRGFGFFGGAGRSGGSFRMKKTISAAMSPESDLCGIDTMEASLPSAPVPEMEHATAEVGYKAKYKKINTCIMHHRTL